MTKRNLGTMSIFFLRNYKSKKKKRKKTRWNWTSMIVVHGLFTYKIVQLGLFLIVSRTTCLDLFLSGLIQFGKKDFGFNFS